MPVRARCIAASSLRIYSAAFGGTLFLPTVQLLGFLPNLVLLALLVCVHPFAFLHFCMFNKSQVFLGCRSTLNLWDVPGKGIPDLQQKVLTFLYAQWHPSVWAVRAAAAASEGFLQVCLGLVPSFLKGFKCVTEESFVPEGTKGSSLLQERCWHRHCCFHSSVQPAALRPGLALAWGSSFWKGPSFSLCSKRWLKSLKMMREDTAQVLAVYPEGLSSWQAFHTFGIIGASNCIFQIIFNDTKANWKIQM